MAYAWAPGIWGSAWAIGAWGDTGGGGEPGAPADTLPPGGTGRASLPKLRKRQPNPRARIEMRHGVRFVVVDDE